MKLDARDEVAFGRNGVSAHHFHESPERHLADA